MSAHRQGTRAIYVGRKAMNIIMCGIAGFINHCENYLNKADLHRHNAEAMCRTLIPRGPDESGIWLGENAVFAHRRLSVIDPEGGKQPMKKTVAGYEFIITYNGELYNSDELRAELERYGYIFTTNSDTEILLYSYIHYGTECAKRLNGIYAFCIWDSMRRRAYLCRDRFGVKPLFYAMCGDTLVFGSEIKAVLAYPQIKPQASRDGLCEIFGIGPARTEGFGVFSGICEVPPAEYMIFDRCGVRKKKYWELVSREHTDTYEETVRRVRSLVIDSIRRQLVSDVPLGTLLSGGLDSSIISAVAARLSEHTLSTYSFDYKDNDKNFKASEFQPDSDRPWSDKMAQILETDHTVLECDTPDLIGLMDECVRAKDLPGMADVDASLLYFCREMKKRHKVILSGECSDEIFGGYPWFRSEKAFRERAFPWCYDLSLRESVLLPEVRRTLDLPGYSSERYEQSVAKTPRCESDSPEEARRREIAYLNIEWFMSNLLDRKDRMSMASGLEVRVPFCDHRLVEYVWNIPWSMKNKDNVSKSILREAVKGILPDDVLYRRKSPYPKTHNPAYEQAIKALVRDTVSDPNAPVCALCDRNVILKMCENDYNFDYGKPFFGQLMAGPQFLGYLYQVNYWLDHYKVRII